MKGNHWAIVTDRDRKGIYTTTGTTYQQRLCDLIIYAFYTYYISTLQCCLRWNVILVLILLNSELYVPIIFQFSIVHFSFYIWSEI